MVSDVMCNGPPLVRYRYGENLTGVRRSLRSTDTRTSCRFSFRVPLISLEPSYCLTTELIPDLHAWRNKFIKSQEAWRNAALFIRIGICSWRCNAFDALLHGRRSLRRGIRAGQQQRRSLSFLSQRSLTQSDDFLLIEDLKARRRCLDEWRDQKLRGESAGKGLISASPIWARTTLQARIAGTEDHRFLPLQRSYGGSEMMQRLSAVGLDKRTCANDAVHDADDSLLVAYYPSRGHSVPFSPSGHCPPVLE
ncbi:hypothetical protein FKP32DRAFT_9741 [Trametes sanguinea]|nr:hypothetical protein FKP32DRAFT_9741 [Trametes sanguinea]